MQEEKQFKDIGSQNARKVRAYAIISKGDQPVKIKQDRWLIPSQSNLNQKYEVRRFYKNIWSCNCPDFQKRNLTCKHIFATKFWLKIKDRVENYAEPEGITQEPIIRCAYCGSENIKKKGFRKNTEGKKQKYQCRNCKKFFVEKAFKKIKADPQIVTSIMSLFFSGLSTRKIQNHLYQVYGVSLTHVTIYNYIRKFTSLINNYVDRLHPQTSDMWHTDEMVIKVKGNKQWLWDCMDRDTRFLLSQTITQARYTKDANELWKEALEKAKKPMFVVTDSLNSYNRAFRKNFNTRGRYQYTKHIQGNRLYDKTSNIMVERLHNTIREKEKLVSSRAQEPHGF